MKTTYLRDGRFLFKDCFLLFVIIIAMSKAFQQRVLKEKPSQISY